MISATSDIIGKLYHRFHDIIAYIMAPARRDGVDWGRQAPGAPPRHCHRAGESVGTVQHHLTVVQLSGNSLDPAHGLVEVAAAKIQVEGGIIQVGRNFRFEHMNSCPSLARIQSFRPSWPLGSCRLAALSP
jgi:hypothetical protein